MFTRLATLRKGGNTKEAEPTFDSLPNAVQSVDQKLSSLVAKVDLAADDRKADREFLNGMYEQQKALFVLVLGFAVFTILGFISLAAYLKP